MGPSPHKIVVDAMGGDFAPVNEVAGSLQALRERKGIEVILVGREAEVRAELEKQGAGDLPVSVVHAPDVVTMEDSPTAALKQKKNSSLAIGMNLHKDGTAHAFVSAGNTGAVLSASTLILGRIKGVSRPTIGAFFPSEDGVCLLVDAGTNVDCRPQHLYEFAVMGSIYANRVFKYADPPVGLLNIGEEASKGNEVVKEAHQLLSNGPLNFAGNVEGRDILRGKIRVVVCDGFVGNAILKFGESVPSFLKAKLLAYAGTSVVRKGLLGLVRGALRAVLKEMDYEEYGGVPVLGVNGVSIIGHGKSTPKAIKNMILKAVEVIEADLNQHIQNMLAGQPVTTDAGAMPAHP